MSFEHFSGNEHIKTQLSRFIATNKILNSYIFSGVEGIGKTTLSDIFISQILCETPEKNGACRTCSACRQFFSKTHPDVIFLKKQKDKKTLGIDEIREQIIKQVYVKPFIASRKFFVIEEGDDLTQEAQNGLLKVLEEPPSYVTFIIHVTKKSMLLDTVLSRSCVLNLRPVPKDEVLSFLKNKYPTLENESLEFYANFSQGVLGKAIKIANDEEYKSLFFETANILNSVMKNKSAFVDCHRFMLDNKDKIDTIIDFMLIFLRDCIFLCQGLTNMVICPQNLKDIYPASDDIKKFTSSIDYVIQFKSALASNVNFTVLTLDLLTQIQNSCNI